jgi:predicted amidophosphoribosyltransferase
LLAYKERGRRDLAGPLGALLGRAVHATLADRGPPAGGVPVLVPVPSARSAAAARGGDHVLRLARHAGPACGVRPVRGALALTRAVRDSAGLSTGERATNLSGAFAARSAPPRLAAIIVDDIVTTGSTLREARGALESAGWSVLGAAVVAATQRRGGESPLPLAQHTDTG